MFYNAENASTYPVDSKYAALENPRGLYEALLCCWDEETCAPRMRKAYKNSHPTLGQCSITAFLAQDIFGGDVYGVPLGDGNFHCFNVIDGVAFDLTNEQFDHPLVYTLDYPQSRENHFAKEEKKQRYLLLKRRLDEYLDKKKHG